MQNQKLIGFGKNYWGMYTKLKDQTIDGVDNAFEYARYIKACLYLAEFPVKSMIDIGFGNGILFKEFLKTFKPKFSTGIEPSEFIYKQIQKERTLKNFKTKIYNKKIEDFKFDRNYDLGICNSMFQYLKDSKVEPTFKKLAKNISYLYFSVPTKTDYAKMELDLNFKDEFAIKRSKEYYIKTLKPYFRMVSYNLLESKILQKESKFPYELFVI